MIEFLSILLFSFGWMSLIQIYNLKNNLLGITFFIIGILFIYTKKFIIKMNLSYSKLFFLVISFIISSLFYPFPYNVGFMLFLLSFILCIIDKMFKYNLIRIYSCFLLSGLILSFQSVGMISSFIMFSRYHFTNFFSSIIFYILKIFGYNVAMTNQFIYIKTYQDTCKLLITWEKISIIPLILFLFGYLLYLILIKEKIIIKMYKIIAMIFICGVFSLFRLSLLIIMYMDIIDMSLFFNPLITFITFIPIILIIYFIPIFNINDINIEFKDFKITSKKIINIIILILLSISLTGIRGYQDPGIKKQGRILVDEYHSDWEWTNEEFNKTKYGYRTVYNYYCLYSFLEKYYKINRNINSNITYKILNGYDILILKTPTMPYNDKEISDIIKFVKNGGGLFLIGDHTNLFGMNYYLNTISKNFGIIYNYDDTFNISTGELSIYKPNPLLKHASIQYNPYFKFATSCSINAPLDAWEVILGYGLGSEEAHYTQRFFFGNIKVDPEDKAGLFLQAVAKHVNKGRVMAFSDSTVFSNFQFFMKGYAEYILGTMEFLNRKNKYDYLNSIFLYMVFVLISIFLILNKKKDILTLLLLILMIMPITILISTFTFSSYNKANYPLPTPNLDYIKISFEHEYSNFILTSLSGYYINENDFTTFFVWTQRMGLIPSEKDTLKDALNSDVIVIINPIKVFTMDTIKILEKYIINGGRVLILDSIFNQKTTRDTILPYFNIYIYTWMKNETAYSNNNNITIGNIKTPSLYVHGGYPIIFNKDGMPIASIVTLGQGRLIVCVDSTQFSTLGMLKSNIKPDTDTTKLYSTYYYIFENELISDLLSK